MYRMTEIEKLVQVKTALADKYLRLARARKSKLWKQRLFRHAETHRRQAARLAVSLEQMEALSS